MESRTLTVYSTSVGMPIATAVVFVLFFVLFVINFLKSPVSCFAVSCALRSRIFSLCPLLYLWFSFRLSIKKCTEA